MKIYKNIILLLVAFFVNETYAGGGWPKEKGTTYVKVAGWWIESKDFFNGNGSETEAVVNSGLFNINVYAEYGITDKLTVTAYVPFFSRSYQNTEVDQDGIISSERPGGDLNSIGDSEIGLKYGIYKKGKIALAASLILGLPLGNDGSDEALPLATGDGEFNQLLKADLGISLYNSSVVSIYGNIYSGFNNRTEGFSDEYRGGLELGFGFLQNKLWLFSKFDTIKSLKNGDSTESSSSGSIFANNTEVDNLTIELAYYISKKIGVSASVAIPLSGKNVYATPAYSGGLFFDL